ncbi:MAG: PilN domain-containing protein [Patescibacteria group bacterium]|nr:PilN domain-containing protein [Patescibacteria group bacterium]
MLDIGFNKKHAQNIAANIPQSKISANDYSAKKPADEPLEMPKMASLEGSSPTKIWGIFILICTILFIGAFLFLFLNKYYKTSQINTAKAKLNQLNEEISSSGLTDIENQALTFQNGISNINKFTAQGVDWPTFFDALQKTVTKDVVFSNFSVNSKKEISMKGQVNNFDSLANFLQSLKNSNQFTDAKLVSSSKSTTSSSATTSTSDKTDKTNFEISAKINTSKGAN